MTIEFGFQLSSEVRISNLAAVQQPDQICMQLCASSLLDPSSNIMLLNNKHVAMYTHLLDTSCPHCIIHPTIHLLDTDMVPEMIIKMQKEKSEKS